ncbi:hypothetical protein GLOIN_2v1761216 [Rhizophagus irregularis DAOM 181602=DAOM 197198]|uniref:SAM domain-containing protein n=1 Tax=Rhizophagus irregularis (strain DAOM 181602 / DAOM 197198 / MUCL 43194) TaxID=747089 RepID=A0A2P4QZV7_RHIID|nr:hypothetical protein GLOIN_2v1761216 [Rhizophagus irregularis DAOM 181602=DAOM 197198]POG83187.1 hypothetical protein GLOIN_2v1761216 [Rhizophagus irregularis DAOM 181602=DAOM 197198]|eukprot:XP_025190053.1 hypothetical protein GLOIN_2v1761216 [Rhizophagus irregularis DAOM 181602=DAOM 197198]
MVVIEASSGGGVRHKNTDGSLIMERSLSDITTPYTPASTSTSVAGNESVSLADDIKKYDTAKLIDFLRGEKDLGLDDEDLEIIRKRKINGRAFLKTSKEEFERYGLEGGPATNLADFAKECKDKKLKAFSSYLSLSEVLAECGLDSDGIDSIPLFSPPTYEIQDSNKVFKRCMEEIFGSPGKISKASDTAYSIEFTKKALDPNSEEYLSLRKGVNKVLSIIVELLKDRACVDDEPERKKIRIESYRSSEGKNNCVAVISIDIINLRSKLERTWEAKISVKTG